MKHHLFIKLGITLALVCGAALRVAAQNTWNLDGNFVVPGLFLGSTNFEAVDFRVGNIRVLRIEPDPRDAQAGNIIGGFIGNRVDQPGSGGNVIGGGGWSGGPNIVRSNSQGVFIGAGAANRIGPYVNDAVIVGGGNNTVESYNSFVGSGRRNTIRADSIYSSIVGGDDNMILTNARHSVIVGGFGNRIGEQSSFIGGGSANSIGTNCFDGVIVGGVENKIEDFGLRGFVGGGLLNTNRGPYSFIGGGFENLTRGDGSTVPGGFFNSALGDYSFAAGVMAGALHRGCFVWADSLGVPFNSTADEQFSVRAGGGVRFETGGAGMTVDGQRVLVGKATVDDANHSGIVNMVNGSPFNFVSSSVYGATIGGGGAANYNGFSALNIVAADFGTVSGGKNNRSDGMLATVGGGSDNRSSGFAATVSGGQFNVSSGASATIGGGSNNVSSGGSSVIGGGANNASSGAFATVPGGNFNSAAGASSFAAGQRASAGHNGSFVWADSSSSSTFASTAANQFLIRAAGGVGIGTATPTHLLHLRGTAPAIALQDNANAGSQAGYISYRNNVSAETAWVGFGTAGSPTFSVVNARSGGHIELRPFSGNVGIKRTPTANALEVEGNASKTTASGWLANSDARIKAGVRTVTGALDKLSQVRLVEFHYTDEYRAQHPGLKDRSYLNVVAQEFEKVFPEHVQSSGEKLPGGDDTILQVDTYPLTIYSAAAIQELNQKLQRRETEITELKRTVEELKALVNTLNPSPNRSLE